MWNAHRAGLGLSHQISSGNDADLSALDYARYLVALESTSVLLLVLEGIRSGAEFCALGREAAELGKPIVLLKIGRTAAAPRAPASG